MTKFLKFIQLKTTPEYILVKIDYNVGEIDVDTEDYFMDKLVDVLRNNVNPVLNFDKYKIRVNSKSMNFSFDFKEEDKIQHHLTVADGIFGEMRNRNFPFRGHKGPMFIKYIKIIT